MQKIKVGILGYGTIGSAVDKLITQNRALIAKRSGIELSVARICDLSPKVHHPLLVRNAHQVINDPSIQVIVEAIGGEKPALDFILAALKKGKSVVTSNKEVIALHKETILRTAEENGVGVRFEAAVGGGIPILSPLSSDLVANDITEVYGIVNGTTNYILSKMTQEGCEFNVALKEAQAKGYAEANPAKDIKGYDASYKAAILASVAFQTNIEWKKVYFEGIEKITREDILYAQEIGYVIKLLAIAKKEGKNCQVRVHPTLIARDHPLAAVSGPMNAIYVKGDAVGELMFYGQGAGGMPTASAIVADVIAIVNFGFRLSAFGSQRSTLKLRINDIADISSRYYIRLQVPDRPGVLAAISRVFAQKKVSIAAVMQKEKIANAATIVILTHQVLEKNLQTALVAISRLSGAYHVCNTLRMMQ